MPKNRSTKITIRGDECIWLGNAPMIRIYYSMHVYGNTVHLLCDRTHLINIFLGKGLLDKGLNTESIIHIDKFNSISCKALWYNGGWWRCRRNSTEYSRYNSRIFYRIPPCVINLLIAKNTEIVIYILTFRLSRLSTKQK